jgi:hypothetical protein
MGGFGIRYQMSHGEGWLAHVSRSFLKDKISVFIVNQDLEFWKNNVMSHGAMSQNG